MSVQGERIHAVMMPPATTMMAHTLAHVIKASGATDEHAQVPDLATTGKVSV